ncbi:MAG: aminoglycoside phosphotransferase, partial [Promicromonosporaceae bacterium]|nr:aminoglycoside phosphotransferase [Promicromonosporaceae bacterium]
IADPADDLAWLLAAVNDDVGEALLVAYQANRSGRVDPFLLNRAMFLGELALARYLQFGLREQLPDVVADATAMLSELAAAVS